MFLEIWANQIPILWRGSVPQNSGRSIKNLNTTKVVTVLLLSFADFSPTSHQFALFSEDGAFSAGEIAPKSRQLRHLQVFSRQSFHSRSLSLQRKLLLRQIDFHRITRGDCLDFHSLIIVRKVIA
jgi:hypothetical protein